MKRTLAKSVIIGAAILFCLACHRAPESAAISTDKARILRIATSYKIQNLDPLKAAHYFLIEYGAAEMPLIYDDDTLEVKPWLLESYARVDDLNWRLTLRPNVKFQNGKPLTADAFAAAMNRQMERSASTQAVISNASVKVAGERELVLTTKNPNPDVPAALADEDAFPIYDVEAVEAAGNDAEKLKNCGCYTGAYRIVSLDEREMRLERNNDYWRGTPPLDSVVVRFIADAQARILGVENGEADIALYVPTETGRMLANRSDAFFVTSGEGRGGPRLFFNVRSAPFDETAVRRAVSLGINYKSLAEDAMDGVFETATGFYGRQYRWAVNNQKTDVAEAEQLLDEAGWKKGADGLRSKNNQPLEAVLLTYPQQPDWATLATAMQAQLRAIGFDIKIKQVDDINAALKNPNGWNAAISSPGIITTGGAPAPYLREYLSSGGENNRSGVLDAELDRLIDELTVTFDENRRDEILRRIQEIVIAEKAYEIRPVFTRSKAVVGKLFRNYQPSPKLHHVTYETRPAND